MEEEKEISLDEVLKLFLVLQLLEKSSDLTSYDRCKEIKEILYKVSKEIENLKEKCLSSDRKEEDMEPLLQRLEKIQRLPTEELVKVLEEYLERNKKDLEIIIEERSNLVLTSLEELINHNYTQLVKLIDRIHNSLGLKVILALIMFLAGIIVGSWVERVTFHKVLSQLHIQNTEK